MKLAGTCIVKIARGAARAQLGKLGLLLLLLFTLGTARAERLALVLGNDQYQHVAQLRNAGADAESMATAFRKAGYKVMLSRNRNFKEMKDDLRAFRRQIQGGDEVAVFFSGHGVQIHGENFLLPVDVRSDNEDQVRDDAVALSGVLADLRGARPTLMLAIIDACRDNPFPKSGRAIGGRGLTRADNATGQMVMYAAGEGQQALDRLGGNDRVPNGVFTRVFVREMERAGVPIDQVLRNVRIEVDRLARSVNHEQVPALYDQVLGTYYFYPPGTQAGTRQEAVAATVGPGQTAGVNLADLQKEEATRKQWAAWQARMQRDFAATAQFEGSADLKGQAWQRFLSSYGQNNPVSQEDEALRASATQRYEQAMATVQRESATVGRAEPGPGRPYEARPAGVLRVSAIPDEAPAELQRKFKPLGEYLAKATGMTVEFTPVSTFADAVEGLIAGKFDMVWYGGFTFVQANTRSQGKVMPLVQRAEDEKFRSVFITNAPDINSLADLRGRSFSFGSESSASGHLMPRYYLLAANINPGSALKQIAFSGAHDATAAAVATGKVDAGALNIIVWQKLVDTRKVDPAVVRVFHTTPPYHDYNWSVRSDMAPVLVKKITEAFLALDPAKPEHKAILDLQRATRFLPSRAHNYQMIERAARDARLVN